MHSPFITIRDGTYPIKIVFYGIVIILYPTIKFLLGKINSEQPTDSQNQNLNKIQLPQIL